MDTIDATNQANQDISHLLYQSEFASQLIELNFKLFMLNIEYLTQYGTFKGVTLTDDIVGNKTQECIDYVKTLQVLFNGKNITKQEGFDLWDSFSTKASRDLLKELVNKELQDFTENQKVRT